MKHPGDQNGGSPPRQPAPLRVLMGIPAPGATAGGPALHLPMLVEDLCQRGDVIVYTMPYGRWSEGESLPRKIWHQLFDLLRFPLRLRQANPDVVHLNSALDRRAILRDVGFALATRLARKPLLIKWHGAEIELLSGAPWPWRLATRLLLQCTDTICGLSSAEAVALAQLPRAPRFERVRNALDLRRYAHQPDLRRRLRLPLGAPLLLFIGRLLAAKGLGDVLRALSILKGHDDAHLLVVGEGPALAPARDQARRLGLADRVHFLGAVSEDEAADYYCGCDILVFPTYHAEGFPMVVFQSVAGGLGIVTTRVRAMADYLQEPLHCLFVPPREPESVAAALQRLLDEPDLLAGMRRNNRELARRFERRVIAAEFATIYSGIRERRDRSRDARPGTAAEPQSRVAAGS